MNITTEGKELAVIVARGRHGIVCCFPVVETIHKDSICHMVEAPADVSTEIREMDVQVAKRAVGSLKGAGVFVVELFLTGDGQILLNEIAPRPHNSGHQTIEACYVSQFEQHLRAILGLPLGDASMKVPSAIMYNLLGEDEGEDFIKADQLMKRAVSVAGASVHWYEKPEMRKQRMMGHITVVGPSMDLVRAHMKLIVDGETQDKSFGSVSTQPSENPSKVSAKDFATSSGNDDSGSPEVSIIMGSDSDLPVMKAAAETLKLLNIPFEITIVSAHRMPNRMIEYAKEAHGRGIKVIIAGAGGAAHLPGMVASMTTLPVLGVPVRGSSLAGVDSLLPIVQMPEGIPVATFTIQNATNAALFAVRMLARIHAHTKGSPEVGIIMGSDSDLPVMKAAAEIFKLLNVSYEITVVSAHQTCDRMAEYAKEIHRRGMKVIIAGMITSMTTIPVLGVPVRGSSLDVVDSLLSTVQTPKGIPVASFAIQNATNAALFAVRMLAIIDSNLHERLIKYQIEMEETVMTTVERLKTIGWEDYRN